MNLHWITILGIVIILIGTVMVHEGNQLKAKKKTEELNKKLDKSNILVKGLQQDNLDLLDKLRNSTIYLNNRMTGGGSYPVFNYSLKPFSKNMWNVYLKVEGENPLYNTKIQHTFIDHLQKKKKMGAKGYQTVSEAEFKNILRVSNQAPKLKGGDFNPSDSMSFVGEGLIPQDREEFHYFIRVWARNGVFTQKTVLKVSPKGDLYTDSFRIFNETDSVNKILLKDYKFVEKK